MNVQFLVPFGLFLLMSAAVQAQPEDKVTWRLKTEANNAALAYGIDNPEGTPIVFNCRPGSGTVKVFFSETSKAFKPGQSVTASLTAGRVTAKMSGRMLPNEEAGVPSFEGTLPASDPMFAAVSSAQTLTMAIRSWRQSVPLRELGNKADRFNGQCRKR